MYVGECVNERRGVNFHLSVRATAGIHDSWRLIRRPKKKEWSGRCKWEVKSVLATASIFAYTRLLPFLLAPFMYTCITYMPVTNDGKQDIGRHLRTGASHEIIAIFDFVLTCFTDEIWNARTKIVQSHFVDWVEWARGSMCGCHDITPNQNIVSFFTLFKWNFSNFQAHFISKLIEVHAIVLFSAAISFKTYHRRWRNWKKRRKKLKLNYS